MKANLVAVGVLAVSITGPAIAQEDVRPDNLEDQMAYVRSFVAPAMTKLCSPLMPSYAAELEASLQGWLARNSESIRRGKEQEISYLWSGKTIDDFERLTIEATRDLFNDATKDEQLNRCTRMLMPISDGADTGGA